MKSFKQYLKEGLGSGPMTSLSPSKSMGNFLSTSPHTPPERSGDEDAIQDPWIDPRWPPPNAPDWYKEQWEDGWQPYWNSPEKPIIPTVPGGPVIPTLPIGMTPWNPMNYRPSVRPYRGDPGDPGYDPDTPLQNWPLWPADDPRWNQQWIPSPGNSTPPGWDPDDEDDNPDGVDPDTEPHYWELIPSFGKGPDKPPRWIPRRPPVMS